MSGAGEKTEVKRALGHHGHCFTCGPDNPKGMNLTYWQEGERCTVRFTFAETEQGPPGHAHGGAVASVLDECMGKVAWVMGYMALAANLSVDFRKPVPLGVPLIGEAWVERSEERKVFLRSELRRQDDATLLAEGRSIFIVPRTFWQDMEITPASGVG